jgi:hypothetical protein
MRRDIHEPDTLARLVAQVLTVSSEPLNQDGYADWLWDRPGGREQMERKTWTDLLGNLDPVTDLLRRQMQVHPEVNLSLVVEGIATPSPTGTVTWGEPKTSKGTSRILVKKHQVKKQVQAVYSWAREVSKYCEVYFTADIQTTARALVAFARADQKPEPMVFNRHLKIVEFHPNPQVQKMMGVADGIGPTLAEALIAEFGTVWHVLSANPEDLSKVAGVGFSTSVRILEEAGRTNL